MRFLKPIRYSTGYKYQLREDAIIKLSLDPLPPSIALEHEFLMITGDGYLWIKQGYAWDGASGPTVDDTVAMLASLPHDALYQLFRDEMLPRLVYKDQADRMLRDLMIEYGCNNLKAAKERGAGFIACALARSKDAAMRTRAEAWHQGVKFGGWVATYKRPDEIHTAPPQA